MTSTIAPTISRQLVDNLVANLVDNPFRAGGADIFRFVPSKERGMRFLLKQTIAKMRPLLCEMNCLLDCQLDCLLIVF